MPIRDELGLLRRQARYAGVIAAKSAKKPIVAYMGWTGEGNIGDEAMFVAHQTYLDDIMTLVPFPALPGSRLLRKASSMLDGICLGGGTLLGNGHFGIALDAILEAAPGVPCFTLGPGCEDSDYAIGNRAGIRDELLRWPTRLSRFENLSVRGPLSVSSLAVVDQDARVSGDPALLLSPLDIPKQTGLIGVNVGVTDDQWGAQAGDSSNFADDLITYLLDEGYRVRLLPTTVEDFNLATQLNRRWSNKLETPATMPTVRQFLPWVAECSAAVGIKLHAQILAATQHVPVIALEYRPKCRDFMSSIDAEDRCMRTDEIDIPTIGQWLSEDSSHPGLSPARQVDGVNARRRALIEQIGTIRALYRQS